jgi:sterol desaturase/sphingolipid hydroxylase (fatty acid hydroxylase superfamily)
MDTKPVIIFAVLMIIFALEGVFPHVLGRKERLSHAVPHVLTAVLNGIVTKMVLAGITLQTLGWADVHSLGLMRAAVLPPFLQAVIVFILFDLWMYTWHLANHRIAFLWRFHRAHHADIEMDTTTALRFHPGELVLSTFVRLPVLILLGMSFAELAWFEVMLNVSTLFHHSNLAVPETWDRMLRIIIVTPNMHRVHHSATQDELNSNFTSLLSLWDRLASTFRMRPDTRTVVFGLPSFRETRYQRLWGFLLTPFL